RRRRAGGGHHGFNRVDNAREGHVRVEELDGGFLVSRVINRGHDPARLRCLAGHFHRGEYLVVERLELPGGGLREVERLPHPGHAVWRAECETDRQLHGWRGRLRDGGAITESHHRVHDRLRVDGDLHALGGHVEQKA